ncbi:MAG: hypothetical protein JXX14_19695 [Deltaproteobacteria bacterium]|nr:hypothetical protein [Deltaproteobacteria bacterium]
MSDRYQSMCLMTALWAFAVVAIACSHPQAPPPKETSQPRASTKLCGEGIEADSRDAIYADCEGVGEIVDIIENIDTDDPGYIDASPEPDLSEVPQPDSNLVWLRCPIGKVWDGSECTRDAGVWEWPEVATVCPEGFRLPSVDEYRALLECQLTVLSGRDRECIPCGYSDLCANMLTRNSEWYCTSSHLDGEHVVVHVEAALFETESDTKPCSVRCVRSIYLP